MVKRKAHRLSENYMDLIFIPRPNLEFEVGEDGLVTILMEHSSFFDRIAQRFFHRPKVSRVHLDAYGSTVWRALDGSNTVSEVLERMNTSFPDEEADMLKRVVHFLATLQRTKLIIESAVKSPNTLT